MSLTRQIGGLGAANIIYLLSQLGVLSLLSKLSTIEAVAAFGFVMAVVQPLFMLLRMGLRANLATDARRDYSFDTFLSIRVIASITLFVTASAIIFSVRPEYFALAVPVALMNAIEMQSDLCYGALQRAGKIGLVARSMFLRGPAALLLFGLVLYATNDPEIAFWSQTIVWLGVQALHDFPAIRRIGEPIKLDRNLRNIKRLIANTYLLGLGQFFAALQTNAPRFFVEFILGTTALGLFTAVSVLQRATVSLFNTVEQAIGWRLSKQYANGNYARFYQSIRNMMLVATAAMIVGIAIAIFAGKPFLRLLYGPEYTGAYALLVWICVAIGIRLISSVLQTAITAQRKFSVFGKVQFVVLIVTLPAAYIGIQLQGLEGAGMAIAATTGLRFLIFAVLLWRGKKHE